jgi:hypothetical protein
VGPRAGPALLRRGNNQGLYLIRYRVGSRDVLTLKKRNMFSSRRDSKSGSSIPQRGCYVEYVTLAVRDGDV